MAYSSAFVATFHQYVAHFVTSVLGVFFTAFDLDHAISAGTSGFYFNLTVGALPGVAQASTLVSALHDLATPFSAARHRSATLDWGFDEALSTCTV